MNKLSLLRQTIRPLFESSEKILGSPEAFQDFSHYLAARYPLPVAETATVGEVIQWAQNEQLSQTIGLGEVLNDAFINPPEVLTFVWEKMLNFLDTICQFLMSPTVQTILWTSIKVGGVCLIITATVVGIRFAYVKMKQRRIIQSTYQEMINSAFCVICQDNLKTHVIVPCGHFCLCENCSTKLDPNHSNCPMCRRFPISFLKVFY